MESQSQLFCSICSMVTAFNAVSLLFFFFFFGLSFIFSFSYLYVEKHTEH